MADICLAQYICYECTGILLECAECNDRDKCGVAVIEASEVEQPPMYDPIGDYIRIMTKQYIQKTIGENNETD